MLYLRRILGRSDRGYGVNLLSFVGREDGSSSRRERVRGVASYGAVTAPVTARSRPLERTFPLRRGGGHEPVGAGRLLLKRDHVDEPGEGIRSRNAEAWRFALPRSNC